MEYPPSPEDDAVNIRSWREHVKVELPDGHTFDPIDYLVLSRVDETLPADGYKSWEEFYELQPAYAAYDLISMAEIYQEDVQLIQAYIQSALNIAETLTTKHTGYGSRGATTSHVFWYLLGQGDFERCQELQDEFVFCDQEDKHWMTIALEDPMGYSLDIILNDAREK